MYSRGAFEREAAEGSDAITPPHRPSSRSNNGNSQSHQPSVRNSVTSTFGSRLSASPTSMRVGGSDTSSQHQQNNKPVPLDKLLLQTEEDFNGNYHKLFCILLLHLFLISMVY